MVRTTERVNRELLSIPGVQNAGSHIGQALLMDEVVGIDFGENWVSVDPSVDYDKTVKNIQDVVDGYPGAVPRRTHLPQGADQGGSHPERAGGDHPAHLWPGLGAASNEGTGGQRHSR